jgi:PEGA domain
MRQIGMLWMVLLLAQGQTAAHASAQAAPSGSTQTAYRELVRKALQEYTLGHWTEARVFFADAHAIWPNARTFRGLGMTCYEARSYVEAIHFLDEALASQVQPLTPKLAQEARGILDQARRFVSTLDLTVEPSDAEINIDDRPLVRGQNGAVLLDPGEHDLRVQAKGFHPLQRTVVADAGEPVHLLLSLHSLAEPRQPEQQPSAAVQPDASASMQPAPPPARLVLTGQRPAVAITLGVLGAGGAAVGWIAFALRHQSVLNIFNAVVHGPDFSPIDAQNARSRALVSLTAAGIGMGLLTTAQYFWLPEDPAVPAWAWVLGGVGAAVGVTGLSLALFGERCDIRDTRSACQLARADRYFGPLLAMHALPLLSLPIMYALRQRMPEQDVQLSFQWGGRAADGPGIAIVGVF